MDISRINRIDGNKGSFEPSVRLNKSYSKDDLVEISTEAQDKVNSKKIADIRKELEHYIKNGQIDKKILDSVSGRIADELLSSNKKK